MTQGDAAPRAMPALLVTTGDTGEILTARAGAGAEDAGRALPGVEPHNSQLQQIGPAVSPPPRPHHQHSP